MASLRKETDRNRTGWRLQYRQNGKRRSLWLGPMSKRAAEGVKRHVEELVRAAAANVSPAAESVKWSQGVDNRIHATLAKWGLVESREPVSADLKLCGPFFEHYISSRTDLNPRTRNKYRQAAQWFKSKFEADRRLSAITAADFEGWLRWMTDGRLSQSSANKHAKRVKRMFREAVKARLLYESPAEETRIGGEYNADRQHYVTPADARAVLAKCDTEWKVIFGLCRYAGFRCPTEVLALTWDDVHWSEQRLRIDSVKTGLRFCPIFPELRPLLDDAWDLAEDGAVYVVTRYRGIETNLRTQLGRIIEAAGLSPWPKMFVNLRASCRTDLEERFAGHVIDKWLGHSSTVARKHYLQVTDAHWQRAVTEPSHPQQNDTAEAGGVTGGVIGADRKGSSKNHGDQKPRKNQQKRPRRRSQTPRPIPPVGLEQPTDSSRDERGDVSAVSPAVSSVPHVAADSSDNDETADLAMMILKRQRLVQISRLAASLSESQWAAVVSFAASLANDSELTSEDATR